MSIGHGYFSNGLGQPASRGASVLYGGRHHADSRPVSGEQVIDEIPDDRARLAGASRNDTRGQDMRLRVPHHVDGASFFAGAMQLEPSGVSARRLHLVELLIMVIGGLPNWGHHNRGYGPSGLLGTILIIVLILVLLGRFPSI
jgi:hypothetical protein